MTDQRRPAEIDTSVAHPARVYDYFLGGTVNFPADRDAAEFMTQSLPGGLDTARANVRANRVFLAQAVRYLATEAGIRQFLDIGTGIPNADNVHGVAQEAAPDSRVVYVDNDPIVLAHANALLQSTPDGATSYINGDLRNPRGILLRAEATLDLDERVALMLVGVLHYIPDQDDPYEIVARLLDDVPSGSYLVLSHVANDIDHGEAGELQERHNQRVSEPIHERSRDQVVRFFDGLDLLGPGVVPVDQWDPQAPTPIPSTRLNPIYGGVARKP